MQPSEKNVVFLISLKGAIGSYVHFGSFCYWLFGKIKLFIVKNVIIKIADQQYLYVLYHVEELSTAGNDDVLMLMEEAKKVKQLFIGGFFCVCEKKSDKCHVSVTPDLGPRLCPPGELEVNGRCKGETF